MGSDGLPLGRPPCWGRWPSECSNRMQPLPWPRVAAAAPSCPDSALSSAGHQACSGVVMHLSLACPPGAGAFHERSRPTPSTPARPAPAYSRRRLVGGAGIRLGDACMRVRTPSYHRARAHRLIRLVCEALIGRNGRGCSPSRVRISTSPACCPGLRASVVLFLMLCGLLRGSIVVRFVSSRVCVIVRCGHGAYLILRVADTGDRPYKCQHCGDQFARR